MPTSAYINRLDRPDPAVDRKAINEQSQRVQNQPPYFRETAGAKAEDLPGIGTNDAMGILIESFSVATAEARKDINGKICVLCMNNRLREEQRPYWTLREKMPCYHCSFCHEVALLWNNTDPTQCRVRTMLPHGGGRNEGNNMSDKLHLKVFPARRASDATKIVIMRGSEITGHSILYTQSTDAIIRAVRRCVVAHILDGDAPVMVEVDVQHAPPAVLKGGAPRLDGVRGPTYVGLGVGLCERLKGIDDLVVAARPDMARNITSKDNT